MIKMSAGWPQPEDPNEIVPSCPPGDMMIRLYDLPRVMIDQAIVPSLVRERFHTDAALATGAAELKPLVKRCPGYPRGKVCGQRISQTHRCCRKCNVARLAEFAPQIKCADDLKRAFEGLDQDEVDKIMVDLRPLLSFDPDAEATKDCPLCGRRRGAAVAHDCVPV